MTSKKIAFIGAGNIAEAMISGFLKAGSFMARDITACDINSTRLAELKKNYKIKTTAEMKRAFDSSDIIFLSVKPQIINNILPEFKDYCRKDHVFISIIAGTPISAFEEATSARQPVIRVMSNVAAAICEAATGITFNKNCSKGLKKEITGLFNDVGKCVEVPETLMDAATALCGSGPAFLYLFIEAMADAALKVGFPRAAADLLAEQVIKGAAMTAAASDLSPAQLRATVTTPAGTTIMGLYQLEDNGLRSAMMKAIDAATDRAAEFSKK